MDDCRAVIDWLTSITTRNLGLEERVDDQEVKVDDNGAKWIKHYSSTHKILLVGEGDFSFSSCLAKAFRSATNMVATSLDSYDFLMANYANACTNILNLEVKGCQVIHNVDATTMAYHSEIGSLKFDRIVFNFPHAGFDRSESRQRQLQRQRNLMIGFFKEAKRLVSSTGEVHVVHKTNGFFREWKIEELASLSGLYLIEKTEFRLSDYPGYQNKYGFGGNKNFDCTPSMTYKFSSL